MTEPSPTPTPTPTSAPAPAPAPTPTPIGSPVEGVASAPLAAPGDAFKSPQELLRSKQAEEARLLAVAAVEHPLFPDSGPRCPRCGERLDKARLDVCPRCKLDPKSEAAGADLLAMGEWKREFLRGVSYLPRGAFRLLRSPSLWKYAIIPLLINALVVFLTLWGAYLLSDWLIGKTNQGVLDPWTAAGGIWWVLAWLVWFIAWLARILALVFVPILATWLMTAPGFNLLYKALFMPFMELLTESTERVVLDVNTNEPFDFTRIYANIVVGILDAILLTFTQALLFVVLLPINIIPLVGWFLWMVLPPSIFAGMDYTDLNLVRRRYTLREKVRLWRHYEWRFLGYGVSFCFLLTIPVLNAVAIPCAVVGGALLYLELPKK